MRNSRANPATWVAVILCVIIALAACAPPPATPVPPSTVAPTPLPTQAPAPTAIPPTAIPPTAAPIATATAAPKPVALKVSQNAALGKFLSDGDGRTLYIFTRDTKNTSTCYDDCAKSWPPFLTQGKTDAGDGVTSSIIGSTTRKEGTTQVTFNGFPLYFRATDAKAGDITGQGIGNVWWIIAPGGDAVTNPPPLSITLNLGPGRDGDQSGTARLTPKGDKTEVVLNIKPGAAGVEQPVHIHDGACPGVGAVKYPLTNIVDGKSTTTVDAPITALLTGSFSINAHKSAADINTYVACGGIPQGVLLKLGPGRDADRSGNAVLLALGNKTEVDLFIKPQPPFAQPAHIHEGACPNVGAVKFPLTSAQDGSSKTVVDASLADLTKGGFSINAHKSPDDINVYVACGAIPQGAPAVLPTAVPSEKGGYGG